MLLNILPSLLSGTLETLRVFALTLLCSLPLALFLASVQNLGNPLLNRILGVYIYIERGTPLMLQLMFVYFGLPFIGLTMDRSGAIMTAFILNYTAYYIEVFRGGIQSVDGGQFEASKALGISNLHMFVYIVLPQALRSCLPSVTNEILNLIKDTSLITVLGQTELLKAGRTAVNVYATALPFVYVGAIYLLMTALATCFMNWVESTARYD
jgi:polar amino acid transport system permease protein